MFGRNCIVIYCFVTILSMVIGDDIGADYYGNRALRSSDEIIDCNSIAFQYYCSLKCGEDHTCLFGECICLTPATDEATIASNKSEHIDDEYADENPIIATEQNKELEQYQLSDYALRPTLRHHIAHFCPNLEEARNCIRKCMKLGKPAFCGKDHVCYCGHNYGQPSNQKENPDEMYNQFQDLYQKYFGRKGPSD